MRVIPAAQSVTKVSWLHVASTLSWVLRMLQEVMTMALVVSGGIFLYG
jgi:hypothetical protein